MGRADEQVNCLVNEEGAGIKYMEQYDAMPYIARNILANADLNICVACVYGLRYDTNMLLDEIAGVIAEDRDKRRAYCCF